MPELPELAAVVAFLRQEAVGREIARIDLAAVAALKTAEPPITGLINQKVVNVDRHGKFIDIDVSGHHLIIHLARAGWLQWRVQAPTAPPKPGRGPLAMRIHFDNHTALDLTEQGTKKGLAVYVVSEPAAVPGIAQLGIDALSPELTNDQFQALLSKQSGRLKNVLTDQKIVAGIGNAYSDEILHAAKLSPYANAARLNDDENVRLYKAIRHVLAAAVDAFTEQEVAKLKAVKRAGFQVHNRAGLPCPVCGDTVREVSFAETAMQYCPTCQTAGKTLADRRMSRLVK